MRNDFYALFILAFILILLLVYICCSTVVFLIVFILFCYVFIKLAYSFNRHRNFKKSYIQQRKMSSKRLNISGKTNTSFNNYLNPKDSFKNYSVSSPVRNCSTLSAIDCDENFMSKMTHSYSSNNYLSPIRSYINSPNLTSPLNSSRKFNSEYRNESTHNEQCPGFLIPENSPSNTPKRQSLSRSLLNSSGRNRRVATTANDMGVDDFPLVCSTVVPIIPFVQSPRASYDLTPQRDSPLKKNRVRVRLTTSHNSDSSLTASSLDMTTLDEPSTTVKAVTQVLKERVRKRTYAPCEEDDEQKDAKRRPEHNLYLSRLNEVEENPTSQPPRRNGEEDRKRIREADWESSNVVDYKRRRTNTSVVNNEILSSLSSSIGLRQSLHSPVAEKPKRKMSIGTQVNLTKESPLKNQMEQSAQTNLNKPVKEVKEAGTMPDPPQPPRPRSPVKEKTVSNTNVILKSALSKFKIQPKEDTKKVGDSSASIPFTSASSTTNVLLSSDSTPSSSSLITASISPLQPKAPLAFGEQTNSSGTGNNLSLTKTMAAPQFNFGSPTSSQSILDKNNKVTSIDPESDKTTKKDDSKTGFPAFKLNSSVTDSSKSESPFTFGKPLSSPSTALSQTAPSAQSVSAGLPDAKSSEAKPASNFSFGSAKRESSTLSTLVVPKTQESNTTSATSVSALPQVSTTPVSFATTPAIQTFKFGGGNENTKQESKSSTFSFGKVENKTASESVKPFSETKPFQFGSTGNFSFGQEDTKSNKDKTIIPFAASTSTASSVSSINPVFSFGGTTKKEEKSGGFPFKLPTSPSSPTTQSPNFSFNNVTGTTPATANTTVTASTTSTAPKNTATLFPSTLFSSSTTTSVGLSTAVTTTATSTSLVAAPAATSATPVFGTNSLFGSNPTSNTTTSTTSIFGASSSNQGSTSIFGSGTNKPSTTGTNVTTAPVFGGSSIAITTPTFGITTSGGTYSNPTAATTSNSTIFGSTAPPSLFGGTGGATPTFGTTSSAAASTFGTPTSTAPTFGSTTKVSPTFGSATKAIPTFGTTTTATPTFGSTTTTTTFGSTAKATPTFGSTTSATPTFGGTTSATPSFGSTAKATPSFGSTAKATPTFGSTTTANSTFSSTTKATPTFGSTTTATPAFGITSTTPAFGATGSNPSTFGSSVVTTSTTPVFGTPAPGTTASTNLFGGNTPGVTTPSFGNSVTSATPAFGASTTSSSNVPAFGSGSSTPAFGSTSTPSFGASSTTPSPFGSSQPQGFGSQPAAPAFGSTPSFGSQSGFGNRGATPAFGSTTPAFGGSSGTNTFVGSNSTPAPVFGGANTTTPTPAFGSTNTATPTPTFGSTNTATNTPTATFGTTNTTTPAPAFGSSAPSTFGTTAFGSQDGNKPFSFNAPATQPPAPTSGFNFTAIQPPQPTSGLFQFGASVSSTPQPNQPFQFNAAQPSAQVGGGGQQMFSIGSGSTAPRRMPPRRKK